MIVLPNKELISKVLDLEIEYATQQTSYRYILNFIVKKFIIKVN